MPEPEGPLLALVLTGSGTFLSYALAISSSFFPLHYSNTVEQVMITPIIINRLQWKAYLIFMATNLAFIPIIYFLYPETSNLSLEEVEHIFTTNENPIIVANRLQSQLARTGRIDVESQVAEPAIVEDKKEVKSVEHVES